MDQISYILYISPECHLNQRVALGEWGRHLSSRDVHSSNPAGLCLSLLPDIQQCPVNNLVQVFFSPSVKEFHKMSKKKLLQIINT